MSSLPSPYGIGTMGKSAYEFIDFLVSSGQKIWQLLPLGHTSFGDSPYQLYSSYAGNPYFIDLDMLCEEGLINEDVLKSIPREKDEAKVDYKTIYEMRYPILKCAAEKFLSDPPKEYFIFLEENRFWIEDYAAFMALKEKNCQRSREDWAIELRTKNAVSLKEADRDIAAIYKVIQYFFFKQWNRLKKYANGNGIEILGDMPIYCASDSADVWSDNAVFMLDEMYVPILVAGVPPDGFSPLGQRWGNPLYDWEYLEKTKYKWWSDRIKYALNMFDIVRIDHFRGFDSYFAIDANEETAVNGRWMEGPKMKLFKALEKELGGNMNIIAEDLGYLTESVKKLLSETGFPGMKILQFAFDSNEAGDYLPHNYSANSVCYVGTHDNDTALGWYESCGKADREKAVKYLNLTKEEGISKGLMRGAMSSVCDTCIITAQDILQLGSSARMNTPSTCSGNWQWRMKKDALSGELAKELKEMTLLYGR